LRVALEEPFEVAGRFAQLHHLGRDRQAPLPDPLPPAVAAELARDDAVRPVNSEGTGPALHTAVMALARSCWYAGLSQGQASAVAALSPYPGAMARQRGTTAVREMTRAWGVCEAEAPGEPGWLTAGRAPTGPEYFMASARDLAMAAARGLVPPSLNGQPPAVPAPAQEVPDGELAAIAARYAPVDWKAAWQDQPDDVDWIREPVLERGTVNALFAEAGTGKSLLTLEICRDAVRAGETVTYLDDENRITDLVERLRAFGAAPGELARLKMYSFASLPPLDTLEGGLHLLALAVRDGATLVVLDTTSRMVAGKENDADTFIQLYRCALVPLKKRGITVLRLDHPGKDPARGQRGSSAKDGDVDTVWRMTAVVGERIYRLERTKSRSGHGDSSVTLSRQSGPLRHEWAVRGASAVDTLCGQLDTLKIPLDAGRPAVRAALEAAGVKVANDLLTEAIRRRKNCPGQSADSADSSAAVAGCPSATHIGGRQPDSCPGQGVPPVAPVVPLRPPAPAGPTDADLEGMTPEQAELVRQIAARQGITIPGGTGG
jgi:AAA domain